ncbi:MAG: hypothetical protein PHY12_05970 [Eubacteriales bacterium]|nr:hypothetical protein [Eubacteriales bacterium]
MADNTIISPPSQEMIAALTPERCYQLFVQMDQSMRVMAEVLRSTNDNVETLKRQLQQMVPLTAAQANALNRQIRQRAASLREQYRLDMQADAAIATAIRKDVKLAAGARSIGELPRSLYGVYCDQVALWDEYTAMKIIKRRFMEKG